MADELPSLPPDDPACKAVVEIITDYLEGVLPESEARRLERHVEICPGCIEYLEQMRALAGSLGGLGEDPIPADVRAGLLAAFRDKRHP
jgi:anti-sigma factor RsiW